MTYLRHRLAERSTWLGFATAVAGGAALNAPYSYIAIAFGIIAFLVPEPSRG